MPAPTAVNDEDIVGYVVAYEREDLSFPVYLVAVVACLFLAAGIVKGIPILSALALAPAAYAFHNIPLLETGKPRLGAGQYGLFIEGLGLVQWSAFEEIALVPADVRGVAGHDLVISLKGDLNEALILDWRNRPLARRFMRLPWALKRPNAIRIPLDIMDRPVGEIHQTILRMWRYYRGPETISMPQ